MIKQRTCAYCRNVFDGEPWQSACPDCFQQLSDKRSKTLLFDRIKIIFPALPEWDSLSREQKDNLNEIVQVISIDSSPSAG
jgi:hypothetical protein